MSNFMPGNIYFFILRKVNNMLHFKNFAKPYVIVIQHTESSITAIYLYNFIINPQAFHFYGMWEGWMQIMVFDLS